MNEPLMLCSRDLKTLRALVKIRNPLVIRRGSAGLLTKFVSGGGCEPLALVYRDQRIPTAETEVARSYFWFVCEVLVPRVEADQLEDQR